VRPASLLLTGALAHGATRRGFVTDLVEQCKVQGSLLRIAGLKAGEYQLFMKVDPPADRVADR
jgi:hypothetical protein